MNQHYQLLATYYRGNTTGVETPIIDEIAQKKAKLQAQIDQLQAEMQSL
jgi:hypothetical protein